nr:uncharacterized mitochondrial protein AtMg00810-like [Tanacetum cinerariifolium]
MTHPNPQRHVVPTAVLTWSKLVSLTAARPITTAVPQTKVTRPRPAKTIITKPYSPPRRNINRCSSPKPSNFPPKVTIVKAPKINATLDESNLWHRRLGHINFKTMNKLVKGIKKEFSVPRTPQQNGIAERKNMTLIEAARTMLEDSLLTIPFWVEVVNTACYVQNMADEGLLVGYSVSSKAFRVFNSRTRIVQETLHINFLENKPNVAGSGPTWPFDIDTLTKSMNYQAVIAGNQPNPSAVKENEFEVEKPDSKVHVSPSSSAKTKKHDDKTKREANGKSHVELSQDLEICMKNLNIFLITTLMSPTLKESSYVDPSQYPDDPNMPALEDITYSDDEEEVGAEADFTNLKTTITEEGIDYEDIFSPVARIEAISQDKYAAKILGKFGLTDGKSASTPIDNEKPLLKDPDGEDEDVHTYMSMIGSLMYLTSSRLDIIFAVCACARFQVTPKASHLHAVKRIFRYLKGKPHLGLWYPKDSPFNLVAYSDSDYSGESLDKKSIAGGCQFLGCRLISWQ